MYICIDFDGTLVDHAYPQVGEPAPLALHYLKKFETLKAKLILFTMRSDKSKSTQYLTDAVNYLEKNGINLYGINVNPSQHHWTSSPKAFGHLYIDDAAFGCPLIHPPNFLRPCVNWKLVGPKVEQQIIKFNQQDL